MHKHYVVLLKAPDSILIQYMAYIVWGGWTLITWSLTSGGGGEGEGKRGGRGELGWVKGGG